MVSTDITYALYARKSTEPDDRQALSIPSQTRECLSKFPEIVLDSVIEESYSAKAPGRPQFNALIERVKRGEITGLVAWHPDRLSRNSVDAGQIIYLLDTGKLQDLKFCSYTFENTPEGKWMLAMVMSQAKYQVDKLSIEVMRGNRQKYEAGGITWRAPQGYVNDRIANAVEEDPLRFPMVRRMWEMLLSGTYTVPQIHRIATGEWGYQTRTTPKHGGRPIALSALYLLFRNPFYCGLNVRPDGTIYECTHRPMVTPEEFWQAQKILGKKGRPRPRIGAQSAYTDSLIRCKECGCSYTIDRRRKVLKSGKTLYFTYCRCTKKRGPCSQRSLRLRDLEDQVISHVGPVGITSECWTWLKKYFHAKAAEESTREVVVRESKSLTKGSAEEQLARLKVMLRKGFIEESEFIDQRAELLCQIPDSRPAAKLDGPAWLTPALSAINFGYRCTFWLTQGNEFDKKTIITTIGGSHLSIFDGILKFQPVGPFAIMAKHDESSTWYRLGEDLHTYFLDKSHQIPIPELPPMPNESPRLQAQ